jgi:hypothetical protein
MSSRPNPVEIFRKGFAMVAAHTQGFLCSALFGAVGELVASDMTRSFCNEAVFA